MAHIVLTPHPDNPGATQLVINGIDFSNEAYRDVRLVQVGDDPRFSWVGFQVTLAVSRLDLGGDVDVQITDHLPDVAQRVHSMTGEANPVVEHDDLLQVLIEHQRGMAAMIDRLTAELKTHPDRIARAATRGIAKKKARL